MLSPLLDGAAVIDGLLERLEEEARCERLDGLVARLLEKLGAMRLEGFAADVRMKQKRPNLPALDEPRENLRLSIGQAVAIARARHYSLATLRPSAVGGVEEVGYAVERDRLEHVLRAIEVRDLPREYWLNKHAIIKQTEVSVVTEVLAPVAYFGGTAFVGGAFELLEVGAERAFASTVGRVLDTAAGTFVDSAVGSAGARGLGDVGRLGGSFSSTTNAAGGKVITSVGDITQADFADLVSEAQQNGEKVYLLTGVHGTPGGVMHPDPLILAEDVARFAGEGGVHVLDVTKMTGVQIGGVLEGTGTTIGAFCNSGICLAPFR